MQNEEARTKEILAALGFLAKHATVRWPFDQFRDSFVKSPIAEVEKEARRQNAKRFAERDRESINPTLMHVALRDLIIPLEISSG
jgi:hypothetical protein